MTATPTKNVRFDMLTIGSQFTLEMLQPKATYEKISTRKAKAISIPGALDFAMKPTTYVQIPDQEKIAELAKPVFDGTRESCKTDHDFYALDAVFTSVRHAYEKLGQEAESVRRKAVEVQSRLAGTFTFVQAKRSWDPTIVNATPAQLTSHISINSLGELQGRAMDFDRQCALVHEKRNHALHVLRLLGYRLPTEEVQL